MIGTQPQKQSKKPKYEKIDLTSKLGVPLLPGRLLCECMAQSHKLINNCTTCGRIICEQEGEGPCFFCGNQVYSKDNPMYKDLTENNFVSLDDADMVSKKNAIDHKNKLLNYDRNMNPQSNIIDDEADWYEISGDIWLTKNQRQFAGQKFREDNDSYENLNVLCHSAIQIILLLSSTFLR